MSFHWNPELLGDFFAIQERWLKGSNQSFRRMTCSIAALFTTNTTKIGLELKADLDGETLATVIYTHRCGFLHSTASYKLQDRPQAFK
jgi:cellulose synthase/poly-beta-1,6-N-acetylglucosamine synthase-like glycosyltransferase